MPVCIRVLLGFVFFTPLYYTMCFTVRSNCIFRSRLQMWFHSERAFFFFSNFATAALRSMHINHVPCNQLFYRGPVFNWATFRKYFPREKGALWLPAVWSFFFLSDLPFWVSPHAAWVNLFVNEWLIIKGWRAYDSQSRHTRTLTLHLYLGTFRPPPPPTTS